jgi:HPt (histidine-containing phosphotransfer) domain-containing protein
MDFVINRTKLDEQTFGDSGLRREVLALFAAQAPILLATLAASSGEVRSQTAHRLKGSALAIGAEQLASHADALEREPDAPSHLQAVQTALADVLNAIPKL